MPSAARLALAAIPAIGLVLGIAFQFASIQHAPQNSLKIMLDACAVPSRQTLDSDISGGRLPALDNFFCLIVPFFKQAVATRTNLGALTLLGSIMSPLVARLTYQAVSPNRKTVLFSGVWIFLIAALGQLLGFGMVASALGIVVYTLGSYLTFKRTSTAVAPVPTAPGSIYLCNLVLLLLGPMLVGMMYFDAESSNWFWTQTAFQFYPVLLLPVVIVSLTTPLITTEKQARDELRCWDAEGVSYSFERTWGNYRKFGGLSAIMYWYGLNQIIGAAWAGELTYDDATHFFVFDIAGTLLTLVSLVAVERLTVRSKASQHPLTGAARSPLDVECDKAIDRAPAGSPWLEKTWAGFALVSLVAGPGCAAALWWCSGEEELGWKARKAWREAVAVEGKKSK
ncbi:hypothetical protein ACQY0O_006350 [Thecaphora frezii]